jgi:hypothetical protein
MSKFYKILLAVSIASSISLNVSAQQYWSSRSSNSVTTTHKAVARQSFPRDFKLFELNVQSLRQQLFAVVNNQSRHSTIISIPNADGQMEQFEVFEASNFEPELQAKFPEIRAFSGKGITDKYANLKLSISPQGVSSMVFRTATANEFIEPYSADGSVYAVYKSSREIGRLPWTCTTEEKIFAADINATLNITNRIESSAGELKTMRLAQSCNGEYANFFGATSAAQVNLVLAAFNATLTRTNGCYEKDLALHLNLIPTTVDVIFYDPATDPYTSLGAWNGQLQTTLTNIIGAANYDIGHMFGASGGGGNAGCIGCVCGAAKGSGITSPADGIPMGDNFDIDYVAHEVGHQLGGNHTFSMGTEGAGVNKEVGSGITIMGYAGITNQDVAPHSIDIFHQTSIQQIQNNLATKTCPVTTDITSINATPVVAPVSNYTIPISTPFALTGSATDANPGDALTYCWEQNDNGTGATTGSASVASPTKTVGPNWLSFPATSSPTRTFPRLSTILSGLNVTPQLPGGDNGANIEALSSVARTLNFRLTVRDNSPYSSTVPLKVGQTSFTDMVVTVSGTTGPFNVSSPNTNVSWAGGSSQNVTWTVNGTDGAPINCSHVNILYSSDGGLTFPTVLVANTPNDGAQDVIIPASATTTARIKVESIGNIFFDISNTNFTVTAPLNGFEFSNPAAATTACPAPASMDISLGTSITGTFSTPIILTSSGAPAGTTVSFAPSTINPGNSTVVTLSGTNTLAAGSYTVTVIGTAGAVVRNRVLTFTITSGAGPAITAQPVNDITCVGDNASFSVTSAATGYQWQVNTGSGFANISNTGVYSGATTNTLTITGATAILNTYQYRVIASIQCGSTTSNAATLTVNTAPAVTTNPQGITLCAGSNHTFTSAATGSGLTYQWEVSTDGGGVYAPVTNAGVYSGALTNSLTITGIPVGLNNNRYRVVVSGACTPAATSTAAILGVVTSVTITDEPDDAVVCAGSNTSFTVAGSGAGIIYQWQVNTGSGFTNITNGGVYSGATSATLTITGASVAMNGYLYRAQLTNATCTTPSFSTEGELTVNTLPAITSNPANSTICLGANTTFSAAGTGTGISYQWQVNTGSAFANITNGGVYSGATTNTLTITGGTAAMNGYTYRAVVSGTCAPAANTTAATLTVVNPVSIDAGGQPVDAQVCSGSNVTFSVTGTSSEAITYQWQVDAGAGFVNVTNAAPYSGANTNTLTITGAATGLHGNQYRVLVSNNTCTTPVASNSADLTVRQLPTVGLTSSATSLLPGQNAVLTATPSTSAGGTLSTSWLYNNNVVANAGNTRNVNVEQVGTYQVLIQEVFGTGPTAITCANESAVVTITAGTSSRLFIFPSPNDGQFTVSYQNVGGSSSNRTITVYNTSGAKVYHAQFNVSGAYTLLPINIKPAAKGIYYVVVGDAAGKKLAEGNVVVQ